MRFSLWPARRPSHNAAEGASADSPLASTKDIRGHVLFRGGLSRFLWQVYTHRFTRAGRWFLALTLLLGLVGATSLEIQTYIPFLYAAGLWTVAVAFALSRPRVRVRSRRHAERIGVGETLPVDVEVEYVGRLPLRDANLLPARLPAPLDAVPENGTPLPTLRRGETARVRVGILCRKRGVYALRGFRVETDFPLGLLNAYRLFWQETPLLVYPAFTPLRRMPLPTGRRYQPGGVALAAQIGDSFELLGNRLFREGDSIRDIDWRATARLGGDTPILREWREEYFLRAGVVLDTQIPPGRNRENRRAALERAISLCAAVSDLIARREYIVDLFAAGPNLYQLTAGRGLAYLDQILDILACVEESPTEPFATIAPQISEHLAQITTVVCVLLDWDETRRAFVETLRQNGAGVKVVLLNDGHLTVPADADVTLIDADAWARGVDEL